MKHIRLPWPHKSASPNARSHWAIKHRATKKMRQDAAWAAKSAGMVAPDGDGPIPVELTFYPPDRRHRDADNMLASSKALLDGIADALGVNDTRFRPSVTIADATGGYVEVRI